jgi:phosphatidylglycerol---prolipoprotein diacylglyceryl transferase
VRPTLAIVAGRAIDSFRALQYLGVLAGLTLGAETARRLGEDPNAFLLAGSLLFIPALIGAHAGPTLARGTFRRETWLSPRQGSAIFFALPLLVLVAPVVVGSFGLSAGPFLDSAAVAVVTGTIFGRFGCLLHGCCAGRPTTGRLGLPLTDANGVRARRVPTQLLDAGWAALLLVGLLLAVGHVPSGVPFLAAAVLYGGGRFLTDFTRQWRPPSRRLGDAQYLSLALIVGGLCALLLTVLESIS